MFPSPNSSQGLPPTPGAALTRYASAPSSLLTTAVGSTTRELSSSAAVGYQTHLAHTALFFPSEAMAPANQNDAVLERGKAKTSTTDLQRSFVVGGGGGVASSSSSSLVRHNSSPPGLINQLATAARDDNHGFSNVIGEMGRADHGHNIESRMNSQLNFNTQHETRSSISKETDDSHRKSKHSYVDASVGMRPWDDTAHPIMFSVGQSKHDDLSSLNTVESQFQFSLGMQSMDKLVNIPQDSIPCKIRAKRGCATHPRSIAERERRTRISGKLKKLHDLVPNMDKQTSYADMLELAVQHIKSLQNKVQKLHCELESCTCGCKNTPNL